MGETVCYETSRPLWEKQSILGKAVYLGRVVYCGCAVYGDTRRPFSDLHVPHGQHNQVGRIRSQGAWTFVSLNSRLKGLLGPVSGVIEKKKKVRAEAERGFFIDNLLVRIHFIIVMIRWTGLAPWEFEFPFPGSLPSTSAGQKGL